MVLVDLEAPSRVFDAAEADLGRVAALVMCHCKSVDSGLLDTTVESFDRRYQVNVRASWLLLREFGQRFPAAWVGRGRVVAREATPLGRGGTPDDPAALVAFLCSADGGWVNGQLLSADGGPHV